MKLNKLFVTYSLAVLAKELGFNETCIAYYTYKNDDPNFILNKNLEGDYIEIHRFPQKGISAILYQQLIDWLESNYELFIERIWNDDSNNNYILWLTKNNQYQELKSVDDTLKDALLMIKDNKIDKKC